MTWLAIALIAFAIFAFVGWKLYVTNGDWPNAESYRGPVDHWTETTDNQIVITINPHKGINL